MSNANSGIKIPNRFIRLHPPDISQASNKPDDRPAELQTRDKVRYILRNGQKGCFYAGSLWWGDSLASADTAIVAYKKIKLEKAWIDWGHKFDRDEVLDTCNGIPTGLDPSVRVKIWLRGYPSPQADTRQARNWDWIVSGESGSDIMKYRVVRDNEDE